MPVHNIPPLWDENSRVLILGSFPSPKSREAGFFYMHPQNRFWKVLAEVFGEEAPQGIQQRKAFALRHRIALWDVLAECEIDGAADSTIKKERPNDFSLIQADVAAVFTTGKTAGALYKKHTGKDALPLPSPSPANCAVSWEDMVKAYARIKEFL